MHILFLIFAVLAKAVRLTNQRAVRRMFNKFICSWPNMAVKRDAPPVGGLEGLGFNHGSTVSFIFVQAARPLPLR